MLHIKSTTDGRKIIYRDTVKTQYQIITKFSPETGTLYSIHPRVIDHDFSNIPAALTALESHFLSEEKSCSIARTISRPDDKG